MKTTTYSDVITEPGDGIIVKPDGTFRRTRSLGPLLKLARKETVTFICVSLLAKGEGSLEIHFKSGHKVLDRFASYAICLDFAENPRRVWNRRGDLLQ